MSVSPPTRHKHPGHRFGWLKINIDETVLTPRIMEAVANVLADTRKVFRKATIVGCGKKDRRAFEKSLQAANISYPVAFFRDFEKAKEWLI